jgi:hypothetical protein
VTGAAFPANDRRAIRQRCRAEHAPTNGIFLTSQSRIAGEMIAVTKARETTQRADFRNRSRYTGIDFYI